MSTDLEKTIKRLWLTYKLYHGVANKDGSDSNEYATACTNGYLEYITNMTTGENSYDWGDPNIVIENQIRILNGLINCYDKPVIRDKIVHKTRWSL